MKKSAIEVGKSYTDGKGNIRRVIGAGPEFVLYSGQENHDCLRYVVIAKKRGPHLIGEKHNSTRESFASWAKEEIAEDLGSDSRGVTSA